ncbi:MAG: SusC/RagA family TonB-linked outer membrane protein, partial [Pedobacter sp.]
MYKKITALICNKCSCIPFKFLLIMKLVLGILLSVFMQVSAASFAQKVNISVKNAHLKEVFGLLRKQTGYDFLYNSTELNSSLRVSVTAKNEELKTVLDKCFSNQPLTYSIKETTVLIKKKQPSVVALQQLNITGKITDEKGQALGNVNIRVKGTQTGAASDANGNYKVNVSGQNAVLVFNYLGYAIQEKVVGTNKVINVVLVQETSKLDEIVVVGYGEVKRADLTGSV